MRKGRRVRATWAACAIISMCLVGCAKAPTCKVSPVELEEMREDISVLKRDLKNAKDREAQLTADLAAKQATLAEKRVKPDSLRSELEMVKKGVGKTEKPKEAPAKPAKQPAAAPGTAPAPAPTPAVKQPAPTPAAPGAAKTPPAPAKTPPAAPKANRTPAAAPKDSTKTPPAAPKKGTP